MTYVKNQLFTNWKRTQKHPVYKDKSDTRRKVVLVRGTLMGNFMIRIIFHKF